MWDAVQRSFSAFAETDGADDPEKELHSAFFGELVEKCTDEIDPYAHLTPTDQVLAYFEYEHDDTIGFVDKDSGLAERIESQRKVYYNMINGIETQNTKISIAVEELLAARKELRYARETYQEHRAKTAQSKVANLKLDIGDCKSKRYFKEKERRECYEAIKPMVAEAQLAKFLTKQAEQNTEGASAPMESGSLPKDKSNGSTGAAEQRNSVSLTEGGGVNLRRRKPVGTSKKIYSDAELTALLKED
jgi:hypothetical protein